MTKPHQLSFPQTDRPFEARRLTLAELRAGDIHSYWSPKEGRLVRVSGLPSIALALLLEFDPNVVAFVERPRILCAGNDRYEISFWVRERSGVERMPLIVRSCDMERGKGRAGHRRAAALIEAATAAYIPLEFVLERDVLAQRAKIALAYRQLPSVQCATQLANRAQISDRIIAALDEFGRMRLAQLEAALGGYCEADLTCVLAYLLHQGQIQCNAEDRLRRSTLFEARCGQS